MAKKNKKHLSLATKQTKKTTILGIGVAIVLSVTAAYVYVNYADASSQFAYYSQNARPWANAPYPYKDGNPDPTPISYSGCGPTSKAKNSHDNQQKQTFYCAEAFLVFPHSFYYTLFIAPISLSMRA